MAVAVVALLAAGCSRESSEEAAPPGDSGPRIATMAGLDTEDRCDLGFNTARFNETTELVHHQHHEHRSGAHVDYTLEEWAEIFVDDGLGMTADEVVEEVAADEVYRRYVLRGVLTHTLDPIPWVPMTDPGECAALARELALGRAAAARYPTVADAEADGYVRGDSYYPGLGVHYQNWQLLREELDPARPVQLLFAGTDDDSSLVGLSYVVSVPSELAPEGFTGPPEGFTGENDRWHRHRSFCLDQEQGGVNVGSDILSVNECAALGGTYVPNTEWWMLHAWLVPGCENDWGVFSSANPRLPYGASDAPFSSGCNSGMTLTDPLELDERGDGPDVG